MPKATTLSEAIAVFDPRAPLSGEALHEFYVARPSTPIGQMEQLLLSLRQSGQTVKLLLSGHRGSGKTTELNRLAERLENAYGNRYEVIPVDVSRQIATLTYHDVVLSMALAVFKRASSLEVITRSPLEAVQGLLERLGEFLQERLYGPALVRLPQLQPTEIAARLTAGVAELEAKYSLSATSRANLQKYVDENLSELLSQADEVASLLTVQTRRVPLLIVEGTDKPDLARSREIFCDHQYALTALRNVSVIYTFPIELVYSETYTQIKDGFGERYSLPSLKRVNRDGSPNPEGHACLEQIVTNRLAPERIHPEALQLLVEASGGAPRFLIRMMRNAASRALAHGNTEQIQPEDARRAIGEERGDFIRMLRSEHYPVLWERFRDKTLSADPVHQELLQMSALLEYSNGGERWCDVHPVLLPEVKKRTGHAD